MEGIFLAGQNFPDFCFVTPVAESSPIVLVPMTSKFIVSNDGTGAKGTDTTRFTTIKETVQYPSVPARRLANLLFM